MKSHIFFTVKKHFFILAAKIQKKVVTLQA